MSYEELVESRKNIGDMTKEELFTYCGGLLSEVWDYEKENEQLNDKILTLENERDILKSKLSETKADIHYLLENGETIYIRNKYIRCDKEWEEALKKWIKD